jgi:hypothetical protein
MGLLDLPAPLFDLLHRAGGALPPLVEIASWAAATAWIGMVLYGRWSPQQRLATRRDEIASLRRELDAYDGPFSGLRALLARLIRVSLLDLGATLGPALAASLPGLFVIVWLSNEFDVRFPAADENIEVRAIARNGVSTAGWRWEGAAAAVSGGMVWSVQWPAPGTALRLVDAAGTELLSLPPPAPAPVLHVRSYWNLIAGNPAGYLRADGPLERVELGLPEVIVVPGAPPPLAGWLAPYLFVLVAVSLALKFRWRLH